jgi:hypothetical protein
MNRGCDRMQTFNRISKLCRLFATIWPLTSNAANRSCRHYTFVMRSACFTRRMGTVDSGPHSVYMGYPAIILDNLRICVLASGTARGPYANPFPTAQRPRRVARPSGASVQLLPGLSATPIDDSPRVAKDVDASGNPNSFPFTHQKHRREIAGVLWVRPLK